MSDTSTEVVIKEAEWLLYNRYRHGAAMLLALLAERNRLREALRRIAYDDRVGDEAINLDDTPRAIARAALGEDKT